MDEDVEILAEVVTQHKAEIEALAAETLALQILLIHLVTAFGSLSPVVRPIFLEALDSAANEIEAVSRAKETAPALKSLQVLEQLRLALTGKHEPQHLV